MFKNTQFLVKKIYGNSDWMSIREKRDPMTGSDMKSFLIPWPNLRKWNRGKMAFIVSFMLVSIPKWSFCPTRRRRTSLCACPVKCGADFSGVMFKK
jgi:hypothetical protein